MKEAVADATTVVEIADGSGVGEARRAAVQLAGSMGFGEVQAGHVALVVTEMAANIAAHAGRGEVLLRRLVRDTEPSLEAIAIDRGPGIRNVAEALRDGHSSRRTAGYGLGTLARLADVFELFSQPDAGSAMLARVHRNPRNAGRGAAVAPQPSRFEWGAVCVAMRGERECGDAWLVDQRSDVTRLIVVDGLGHGSLAFDAAQLALHTFSATGERPAAAAARLHAALSSTRGAAAFMADIGAATSSLRHCGVGNISGSLFVPGGRMWSLVSHHGTLGHGMPAVLRESDLHWPPDALLVLHSDGVAGAWSLDDYPGLALKDPALVAAVLYRDHASRSDDAMVLVGRHRGGMEGLT